MQWREYKLKYAIYRWDEALGEKVNTKAKQTWPAGARGIQIPDKSNLKKWWVLFDTKHSWRESSSLNTQKHAFFFVWFQWYTHPHQRLTPRPVTPPTPNAHTCCTNPLSTNAHAPIPTSRMYRRSESYNCSNWWQVTLLWCDHLHTTTFVQPPIWLPKKKKI